MVIEKYEPVNLFALVPLKRDVILDQLDRLLDDDVLFEAVKADYQSCIKDAKTAMNQIKQVHVQIEAFGIKLSEMEEAENT